jgi:AraC-like DNA-binding protein/quercetin dioxygenase-like cupin family protein
MRPPPRTARREQIPRDSSTAITVRDVTHSHFSYPWHYHPEAELILIVRGRGLRYVGDSIGEFEPGEVCLVAGGTPHCWLSRPEPGRPVRALVIQFPPDVFGADFLDLVAVRPVCRLIEHAARGVLVEGATRTQVTDQMWRLTDPAASDLNKLVRLLSILTSIAISEDSRPLALNAGHRPQSSRDATRAGKLMRHIHDHAAERLAQRDVAALIGMSPGAFSRFFTRHFGKPFVAYVAEVRVGHACRLLLEQDLNVSEIAYQVGFNNLANFNRHFLKLKGMTPTAYRKIARSLD